VGVEKLRPTKLAQIKLRQDVLQTTFAVFLDIFYPPNFRCFEKNGLFQHPQAITLQPDPSPQYAPRAVSSCNPRGPTPTASEAMLGMGVVGTIIVILVIVWLVRRA